MIERKYVRNILGMIDIMKQYFTEEAFLVAVYISIKYSNKIFEKKIDDNKMEKIYEELKKQKDIFVQNVVVQILFYQIQMENQFQRNGKN